SAGKPLDLDTLLRNLSAEAVRIVQERFAKLIDPSKAEETFSSFLTDFFGDQNEKGTVYKALDDLAAKLDSKEVKDRLKALLPNEDPKQVKQEIEARFQAAQERLRALMGQAELSAEAARQSLLRELESARGELQPYLRRLQEGIANTISQNAG